MKKLLPIIIVIIVVPILVLVIETNRKGVPNSFVTNFEECADAGNPIMESYPRQCRHGEQTFVEVIEGINLPPPSLGEDEPVIVDDGDMAPKCYIGGCSAQICSDQKDMASDCMYRPEYACYQSATCERQISGECGWTETPTLRQCLSGGNEIISGYIKGQVTIGPNCPVEEEGKPCPTPPEAYSSREVIVYENDKITVSQKGKIDSDGNYKIVIEPGNYFIQIKPAGIGEGEKKPVKVISSKTTIVDFDIDTGIR